MKRKIVSVTFHQARYSQIGHGWNEVQLICGHWFPCKASRKLGFAANCKDCKRESRMPIELPQAKP